MKRIVQFSRGYIPAAIASTALILFGLVGYFTMGFNKGVDFQAGINETVQLAFPAMELTYTGKGNAVLGVTAEKATLVFSGAEVQARTVDVSYKDAPTIGALAAAFRAQPEVFVKVVDAEGTPSALMVPTYQGETRLGPAPVRMHRAPAGSGDRFTSIEKVRAALGGLGDVSVQVVNPAALQRFLVRVQDKGTEADFSRTAPERIKAGLEKAFGESRVVVIKTDYVGPRYSATLSRQAAWLFVLTILVILIYATARFGFQYGFGAVLATVHDALVMICFIVWTRMEFNSASIAAILTILGYSINDTIVQFDRVREDRRLAPSEKFGSVLNRALTETLGRTIITTLCTMITVLSIFFFTTGSLKDFALALFVGMVSGTYSTIFIASAFVLWWEDLAEKRKVREQARQAGLTEAAWAPKAMSKAAPKAPKKAGG